MLRIGAIEAGGTKIICGIGNELGHIERKISFPTETPIIAMEKIKEFFANEQLDALGVGTFGPIDVNKASETYGFITTTPKPGWGNFNILAELRKTINVPIGFDTDVNGAALAEATWGSAKGMKSCVYYTIGTGVGVGVYAEGRLIHGLLHPEAGHIPVKRHPDDTYEGSCPYHKDCLEGVAAGPAIERRYGVKGSELSVDHEAWKIEAYYIAQALTSTVLLLSPEKIILGGGVMHQEQLFPLIREQLQQNLNGYVQDPMILENIDQYVVAPGLGDNAGLCGAIAIGLLALD
ncbi:MAG: ROK family protein [Candidatus Pristimantibacillus lignocellulolyticus]|uniref:fructokinase n=1 Tax=Candidatus Pristimantibacillus lignocellulolyticus TaxID=2994561 RepID=A0A9J6ZFB9_9BACL|nr:MAG: ROK family protein [Candidatus Pristimantibacillus lignocellulolyticus]